MPGSAPVKTLRSRNDEALIKATTTFLSKDGWGGLTMAAIARLMGTSIRPVVNRAPDRGSLLSLLWNAELESLAIDLLQELLARVEVQDPAGIAEFLPRFQVVSDKQSALVETLIASKYEPLVFEIVNKSFGSFMSGATSPGPLLSTEQAARNSFALQLGLGLMLSARYPRMQLDLNEAMHEVAQALCTDTGPPDPLPTYPATHMDQFPTMAPEDPNLELVLRATLRLMSERGYEGTRIVDIATEAGITEGFIFSRYSTKKELLADSLRRQQTAGFELNNLYLEMLERDCTPGVPAAIFMTEIQKPGRDLGRNMALELLRLSWHDPDMLAEATAAMDAADPSGGHDPNYSLDSAIDFGTYLLPRFAPDAWQLPLSSVTVPWHDQRNARKT